MLYKIQSVQSDDLFISIDETLSGTLGLTEHEVIVLNYGNRNTSVQVRIHSAKDENQVYVSEVLVETLLMDTQLSYNISFKENVFIIGPVVGLLLGRKEEKIKNFLDEYLIYTLAYRQIQGLLFVFAEDGIDFLHEQISGYIYDENSPTKWRKSIIPFPAAIFRRVELSQKTIRGLSERLGRNFFNAEFFDKWQFWKWLSPVEDLRPHLPETTNEVHLENVEYFIEKYGGVYLKPRNGSRGKGIHYIEKEEGDYTVIKNYDESKKRLTESEISEFLSMHPYYLLQEPIHLHQYENRKVDYRVMLQKNENGIWQCTGMIARFGGMDAISSNFKAKGFAMEGSAALKKQFSFDELRAFQKYQEIIHICIKAACKVDEKGSYADFGIDIGIDDNEDIWIIEMNKRPDHDFPLLIKDRKMYYDVKSNPVLYCNFVAMGCI